jgi:23S rRNA (adenine2503-C2)-methyltransferase
MRPTAAVAKRLRRLADHDVASLASYLRAKTGCSIDRGRRIATKAFRIAFRPVCFGDDRAVPWTDHALETAQIGRWVRPLLLELPPRIGLEVAERVAADDGTVRLLLRTHDGLLIESVLIPSEAGRNHARTTLCISSQVGCARACTFCETGVAGLSRQLTAGEIVDQYRIALSLCREATRPVDKRARTEAVDATSNDKPGRRRRAALQPISNIVFMGMGEPFDNLQQVTRAISLLCEQAAFDFAVKRITVSTVGIADKLTDYFAATRAELAISINAPDDTRRSQIMPINERFDMATLRAALLETMPQGRRVLFQYALFDGFNDSDNDADALASWVEPVPCRVNIIPANPGPDPSLTSPSTERVDRFVTRLQQRGVMALVRRPRGRDVGGACGQLAGSRRLVQLEGTR